MASVLRRNFGQSGICFAHLGEVVLMLMISVSYLLNSHVSAAKVTVGPTTRPPTKGPTTTTRRAPGNDLPYTVAPFYSAQNCPNPQINGRECRPKDPHKSYFCNPNSILSTKDATVIDTMLRQIRTGKKCTCEANIPCLVSTAVTVVVLKEARTGRPIKARLRDFSDELRKKWDLGSCGDDLLLVVSNVHKSASLSVGDPLKAKINDTEVARIEKIAGDVKNLKDAIKEISGLLGVTLRDPASAQLQSEGLSTWTIVAVVSLIIGFIIVIALAATIGSYCGRKCNNDQSKLESAEVRAYSDPETPPVNKQRKSRNILRSKRTNEERPEGNKKRAWFGRIRRNDRGKESTRGSSTRSNNMYIEPEETRESNYNDSRHSKTSGVYDNNKRTSSNSDGSTPGHYGNSQDSAGSYGDRPSAERNSGSAYGESRLEF